MDALLPSEIARLVLGYLQQECGDAAACFLKSSPLLTEYYKQSQLGKKYPTTVNGYCLTDILHEYCSVHEIVQDSYGQTVSASADQPKSLLERLRHLVKSCQPVQVNISLCTRPDQSSKPDLNISTQDSNIQGESLPLLSVSQSGPQQVCYTAPLQNLQGLPSCFPQTLHVQPKDLPTVPQQSLVHRPLSVTPTVPQQSLVHQPLSVTSGPRLPVYTLTEQTKLDNSLNSASVFVQQAPQSEDLDNRSVHSSNEFLSQNSDEQYLTTSQDKSPLELSSNLTTMPLKTGSTAFSSNYTVTESYGSNIVILNTNSHPGPSCLPAEFRDDIRKEVAPSNEKSKPLTPSKAIFDHRNLTEKMYVAIGKNTAFTEKIAANITKVIQATPVKQSDTVSNNPAVVDQCQTENGVKDIVDTIMKETEEDPIFDSFLNEFLNFYDPAPSNSNEMSENTDTSLKKKKKSKQNFQRKSNGPALSKSSIVDESHSRASSDALDQANLKKDKSQTFGVTPAKLTPGTDTLTPLSKLLKSITSPSDELYLEPSQFSGSVNVGMPESEVSKADSTQEFNEQMGSINTTTMTVPVIVCSTSQQAAQYVNQQGASTICEFQLVPPTSNYVPIAPKPSTDVFQPPDVYGTRVRPELKSVGRRRPLTRGGRLNAGPPRAIAKAPVDTVTIYAAGDTTQSSTLTLSAQSLPIIIADNVACSDVQNTAVETPHDKLSADIQDSAKLGEPLESNSFTSTEASEAAKVTSPDTEMDTSAGAPATVQEDFCSLPSLMDTSTTGNTPGMQYVKPPKDKRQSMSTPRRRRSHIRTLDFNTPPKDTSQSARKANTSPKTSSVSSSSPLTAAKFVKSCSRRSFLKSNPESGVRTNKVKAHLFKSPEYLLSSSSGYKAVSSTPGNASSAPASSPKPSAAWDHVSGVSLILENSDSSPAEHQAPKKPTLKSWDADLRFLVPVVEEKPKMVPLKKKKKISSLKYKSKTKLKKKTKKKDASAELLQEAEELVTVEEPDASCLNVSNTSECDVAKMIEENLLNASGDGEPEILAEVLTTGRDGEPEIPAQVLTTDTQCSSSIDKNASASPKPHSSPQKSLSAVSSPKSENLLDFEANIKAYCIEKDPNAEECCEETACDESASVRSENALCDKSKTSSFKRKEEEPVLAPTDNASLSSNSLKNKGQSCYSENAYNEVNTVEVSLETLPTRIDEQALADDRRQIPEAGDTSEVLADKNLAPVSSIFDTPSKEDFSNMVPLTPRILITDLETMEDTPRTKIIKSHPPPCIPSTENSVQSPTLPPTPTMPKYCASPTGPEYFEMDGASDNAVECAGTVNDKLESILIQECNRIEIRSAKSVESENIEAADSSKQEKGNDEKISQMDEDREAQDLISPKLSEETTVARRTKRMGGCARARRFVPAKNKKSKMPVRAKATGTSGDETDISLLSSPKESSICSWRMQSLRVLEEVKGSVNSTLQQSVTQNKIILKKGEIEQALDTIHGKEKKVLSPKEKKLAKKPSASRSEKSVCGNKLKAMETSSKNLKGIQKKTSEIKELSDITAPEAVESLLKAARKSSKKSPVFNRQKNLRPSKRSLQSDCSSEDETPVEGKDDSSEPRSQSKANKSLHVPSTEEVSESLIPATSTPDASDPKPQQVVMNSENNFIEAVSGSSRSPSRKSSQSTNDAVETFHTSSQISPTATVIQNNASSIGSPSKPESSFPRSADDGSVNNSSDSTPLSSGAVVSENTNEFQTPSASEADELKLTSNFQESEESEEDVSNVAKTHPTRADLNNDVMNSISRKRLRMIALMKRHLHTTPLRLPSTCLNESSTEVVHIESEIASPCINTENASFSQETAKEDCSKSENSSGELGKEVHDSPSNKFNIQSKDSDGGVLEVHNDEEFPHLQYSCDEKEDTNLDDSSETFSSIERAVAEIHGNDENDIVTSTSVSSRERSNNVTTCEPSISPPLNKASDKSLSTSSEPKKPETCDKTVESMELNGTVSPSKSKESGSCPKKSKRTSLNSTADKILKGVLEQGLGKIMKSPPKEKIRRFPPGTVIRDVKHTSIVDVEYPESNGRKPKPSKHLSDQETVPDVSKKVANSELPESVDTSKTKKLVQEEILGKIVSENKGELGGSLDDKSYRTVVGRVGNTLEIKLSCVDLGRKSRMEFVPMPAAIQVSMEGEVDGVITLGPSPFFSLYDYPKVENSRTVKDGHDKLQVDNDRGRHCSGGDREDRRRDRSRPRRDRSCSPGYRHPRERRWTSDKSFSRRQTYSGHPRNDSRHDNHKSYDSKKYDSDSKLNLKSRTKPNSNSRGGSDTEEGEVVSSDDNMGPNSHRSREKERPLHDGSRPSRDQEIREGDRKRCLSPRINSRPRIGSANHKVDQRNLDNAGVKLSSSHDARHPKKDSETVQNKDIGTKRPLKELRSNKLEEIEYNDSDLDNDLKRFSVLGDIGANSPSRESEADADVSKVEKVPLRRAPPRSVNASKVSDSSAPVPKGKRKSSTNLESASEESSLSSSQADSVPNRKRQRVQPQKTVKAASATTSDSPGKVCKNSPPRKAMKILSPGKVIKTSSPGKVMKTSAPRKVIKTLSPGKVMKASSSGKAIKTSSPGKMIKMSSSGKVMKASEEKQSNDSADILKELDVESFLAKIYGK